MSSAVVTGAASGIGRALATRLAIGGSHVHLADVDRAALTTTAAEIGNATVHPLDVADPDAMERFAAATGPVDLVCLNAGVVSTETGPPWAAPPAEWDRVIGVNLLGVVNGLRAFVPRLLEAGHPTHLLITASLAGAATWPGGGPYAASKHAALAVAEQTALALVDTPIGVTVLCPALVRTGMSDQGEDPAVVAAQALDAMADGVFAMVPGEWHSAVHDRAATLVSGRPPSLPVPAGDG